ncbi:MAG: UDP-glucose 6-dehydrogenase, partial [Candidatus Thorarchaeota archaeon]
MRIVLIGAGYVGLATGVVLAETHQVTLIDIDSERVATINRGETPIHEEGLETLLKEGISSGR